MSSKFFTSKDYSSWMAKMKNFEVLKGEKEMMMIASKVITFLTDLALEG